MKRILGYRKLILLAIPILLVVCIAAYILLPLPIPKLLAVQVDMAGTPTPLASGQPPTSDSRSPTGHGPIQHGPMYEIKDMVVNLAEAGARRYLKATIVLEFLPKKPDYFKLEGEAKAKAQTEFLKEISTKRPIIEDTLVTTLSSKTVSDVFSLENKNSLKVELLGKLNGQLGDDQVIAIYFTQFVIQ